MKHEFDMLDRTEHEREVERKHEITMKDKELSKEAAKGKLSAGKRGVR